MTQRTSVATQAAPAAIGPYSQAIRAGDLVFCSGQIPLDPATGNFVPGGIEEQTRRCLENLQHVLAEAGSGLDQAVRTTVFLKDMEDFPAMNAVYATFFTEVPPARATVEVTRLPKDAMVEIDCIAVVS
jgi:2-iminobutanoate/2-iminopropanoate deaminase